MSDTDKQTRREAKELVSEAEALLERGDYARARDLLSKVTALAPGSEAAHKAAAALKAFALDPWAIYAGLGFALLFLLAWVAALG